MQEQDAGADTTPAPAPREDVKEGGDVDSVEASAAAASWASASRENGEVVDAEVEVEVYVAYSCSTRAAEKTQEERRMARRVSGAVPVLRRGVSCGVGAAQGNPATIASERVEGRRTPEVQYAEITLERRRPEIPFRHLKETRRENHTQARAQLLRRTSRETWRKVTSPTRPVPVSVQFDGVAACGDYSDLSRRSPREIIQQFASKRIIVDTSARKDIGIELLPESEEYCGACSNIWSGITSSMDEATFEGRRSRQNNEQDARSKALSNTSRAIAFFNSEASEETWRAGIATRDSGPRVDLSR
ncbi:hypothetical protein B0H12DRAFT_1069764 [Mycena haematopus]|nr:hypothetical protein B0H12DRAFT_1069764 [Mycena haematopus]